MKKCVWELKYKALKGDLKSQIELLECMGSSMSLEYIIKQLKKVLEKEATK